MMDLVTGIANATFNGTSTITSETSSELLHTVTYSYFSDSTYPTTIFYQGIGGMGLVGMVLIGWLVRT